MGAGAPAGDSFTAALAAAVVGVEAAAALPRRRRVTRFGELLFLRSPAPALPTAAAVGLCSRRRDDGHLHIFLLPPPALPIRRRPPVLSGRAVASASSPPVLLPPPAAESSRRTFASKLPTLHWTPASALEGMSALMRSGETCTACDLRRSPPTVPATSGLLPRHRCPLRCSLGLWGCGGEQGGGERFIQNRPIFWDGCVTFRCGFSRTLALLLTTQHLPQTHGRKERETTPLRYSLRFGNPLSLCCFWTGVQS